MTTLTVDPRPKAAMVSPLRPTLSRLQLICLLLVISAVAWRRGVYYSGGADIVVVAKAALSCLAFGLAATAPAKSHSWSEIRATPLLWLAGYLLVATVSGSIIGTEPFASIVLAIRLSLLATTLLLIVRAYPWRDVLGAVLSSMLLLGAFASVTGVGSLASGRLEGGIPPLSPNEISMLFSLPLIALVWRCFNNAADPMDVLAVPVLTAAVWASGSRTGFATLLLSVGIILLMARRVSIPVFCAAVLALPAALYVVGWTSVVSGFVDRDDAASLTTLNSRTVAWSAAVHYAHSTLERLIGAGLALRQIPVSAMYRDQQILDSTWMSALIQVGVVGIVVMALFVLSTLRKAWTASHPERSLYFGILVYLTIVSFLESGLFDTTVAFTAFFTLALGVHLQRSEEREP